MVQFRTLATAAIAGLFATVTAPAAASVMVATYSGIVASGFDETGVFGAANTDLSGAAWVATYTYDRSLGGVQDTDGATYDISYGGVGYGYPGLSPIISATISINGVKRTISGATSGFVETNASSPYARHLADDVVYDDISAASYSLQNYAVAVGMPWSLEQTFGPVTTSGDGGGVEFLRYDLVDGTTYDYAYAYFAAEMIYSVSAAVPEPASWALMIAGFGLVGAAQRRTARRSSGVAHG